MIATAEPIAETQRQPKPYCGLIGHTWMKCHGGVECSECETVILDRSIVLPDSERSVPSPDRHVVLEIILAALMIFGALWANYVRFCL